LSRVGNKTITVPKGVEISITKAAVTVKGPKGTLVQDYSSDVSFEYDKDAAELKCLLKGELGDSRAKWGLYRMLVANMIIGVSSGFSRTLVIEGVGYRAELKGKNLLVSAGFSHPFLYLPQDGITFAVEGTNKVIIAGIDKQKVGQVASEIRAIRPPEPYKGKGIRYDGEVILRKAGKSGSK